MTAVMTQHDRKVEGSGWHERTIPPVPGNVVAFAAMVAIAIVWAAAVILHRLHLDLLFPPAVLVATASVLRGGRTLLDRLVLAFGLLFGTLAGVGILLPVWPPRLHPVALTGTALTIVIVVASVTRRTPHLPRPILSDAVLVAAAGCATAVIARPLARGDAAHRLATAAFHDDFPRHLALFDSIRTVGGYVFWHTDQVKVELPVSMFYYPQGSHLLYAVLDNCLRSTTAQQGMASTTDHYIWLTVFGFFLMTLVAVWATRWIGGSWISGSRYVVPVTAVAAYCGFGEPVFEFATGHTSQLMGIALVLVLIAALTRPLRSIRDQVTLLAVLLIGIGYTYYLFWPAAALAVAGWLVVHRRRVLGVWRTSAVCAVAVCVLVPILPVLGLADGYAQALIVGPGLKMSREFLAAMMLLVIAGLAGRVCRRVPAFRAYAWAVGCFVVTTGALGVYQRVRCGYTGYYFEKIMVLLALAVMVGLGSLATHLPVRFGTGRGPSREAWMDRGSSRERWMDRGPSREAWLDRGSSRGWWRVQRPLARAASSVGRLLPTVLVTGAMVASLGVVKHDSPYRPFRYASPATTFGRWYSIGGTVTSLEVRRVAAAHAVLRAIGDHHAGPIVVLTGEAVESYFIATYASTLARQAGASYGYIVSVFGLSPTYTLENLVTQRPMLRGSTLRVVVTSADLESRVIDIQRRHADLDIVVYRI